MTLGKAINSARRLIIVKGNANKPIFPCMKIDSIKGSLPIAEP
jgi:hypothetical protein